MLPSFSLAAIIEQGDASRAYDSYFTKILKIPKDSIPNNDSNINTGLELNYLFDGCYESDLTNYVIRSGVSNQNIENCGPSEADADDLICDLSCDEHYDLWEYHKDHGPNSNDSYGFRKRPYSPWLPDYNFLPKFVCRKFKNGRYFWYYQPNYFGIATDFIDNNYLFQTCQSKMEVNPNCPQGLELFGGQHVLNIEKMAKRKKPQEKIFLNEIDFSENFRIANVAISIHNPSLLISNVFSAFDEFTNLNFTGLGWTVEIKFNQAITGFFQSYDGTGLSTVSDGSSVFLHSLAEDWHRAKIVSGERFSLGFQLISEKSVDSNLPSDLAIDSIRIIPGEFSNLQCLYDQDFDSAGVINEFGKQVKFGGDDEELENKFDGIIPVFPGFEAKCVKNTIDGDTWENVPSELQTEELENFMTGKLTQIRTTFADSVDYCLTNQDDTNILSYNPFSQQYTTHHSVRWIECGKDNETITDSQFFQYQKNDFGIYQIKSSSGDNQCLTPFPLIAELHENLNSCDTWKYFENAGTFLFLYDCLDQEESQSFHYDIDTQKLFSGCDHKLPLGKVSKADGSFHAFLSGDSQTLTSASSVKLEFGQDLGITLKSGFIGELDADPSVPEWIFVDDQE